MQPIEEARFRHQLNVITYAKNSTEILKQCQDLLPPDSNKIYMISVGLLTKFQKLYGSILRSIKNADNTGTSILIRPFYETGITIQYLMKNFEESDFNQFIYTDAVRRRAMLSGLKKSPRFSIEQRAALKASVEQSIIDDDLKFFIE